MNDNHTKLYALEDAATLCLKPLANEDIDQISASNIQEAVNRSTMLFDGQYEYEESDIEFVTRRLEEKFDTSMSLGTMFYKIEDYRPWLDDKKGDIDWYYRDRFLRFLDQEKFPPRVIQSIDYITDQILDHLENPSKEGPWKRRGLVVGHVQSGKTINYTALINKASDCGYRVIIVLAGLLNSLRDQTQERLDEGFIGFSTKNKHYFGVGNFDNQRKPASFTTSETDFKSVIANAVGVGLADLKEPVILVIKKHKNTLENLIDWLKFNNPHNLDKYPMLLIDDEADNASVNTSKDPTLATTINRKIRELISLFSQSTYLGYTATPFANVFIDPDSEDKMIGDDLFPEDFILSLDPPSNYLGATRIFTQESDLDILKIVDDFQDVLPLKHKKDHDPGFLPESLENAIIEFVIARAIRLLRGHQGKHHSMMINATRFTIVQGNIKLLVKAFLRQLQDSILNYYRLDSGIALQDSVISRIFDIWDTEFSESRADWEEVQMMLKESVSKIGVIEVNSSSNAEPLDYSKERHPNGRSVIAIGGMSLSRGLTLEGLMVSYFLRNSIMYDTLMQMGRWFGYRPGYEDLCRIHMTAEAQGWYTHISTATEELRNEFRQMNAKKMTPRDFGLCVRNHPDSLIVTARNKMRTGRKVLREVSLDGRLVETAVLIDNISTINFNIQLLNSFISEIRDIKEPLDLGSDAEAFALAGSSGYLWQMIGCDQIVSFIKNFRNHNASILTEATPLITHIEKLRNEGIEQWDVLLASNARKKGKPEDVAAYSVYKQKRAVNRPSFAGLAINGDRRRVGYASQEAIGLDKNRVQESVKEYLTKNTDKESAPASVYRELREELTNRPLLLLHLLDCHHENQTESIHENGAVAYGISFPGSPLTRRPERLVEYIVNTTWWRNQYADVLEEEEENYDE
jgi:hypothetical protein